MAGTPTTYRYAIDYYDDGDQRVGSVAVTPDFEPLIEWAWFDGIRTGRLPALTTRPTAYVEPVWAEQGARPAIAGIRAVIPSASDTPDRQRTRGKRRDRVTCEASYTYLGSYAREGSVHLVERGALERGQTFRYAVSAFAQDPADARREADAEPTLALAAVSVVSELLPIGEVPLADYLARASLRGAVADEDFRVLVPAHVLDEILAHAKQAGDVETGGVLVGHLRRTPGSNRELYLEVTAQVPALHVESQTAKLTFTAETWSEAQSVIELRGCGELMVGWWHLHPHFCKACPPESQRNCLFAQDFFSNEDVHLHRTCFSRAWQVAVLVSDHGGPEPSVALFSWRKGSIVERGFDVLADERLGTTDSNARGPDPDPRLAARVASCDTGPERGDVLRAAEPKELTER